MRKTAVGTLIGLSALATAYGHQLWPEPQSYSAGKGSIVLCSRSSFSFKFIGKKLAPELKDAIDRYTDIVFGDSTPFMVNSGCLAAVTVSGEPADLDIHMDESYTLTVPASGDASIDAKSSWGAMRGLETFSQLVTRPKSGLALDNVPATVTDYPRFPHRGVMLDTARHFLPVDTILTMLDGMVADKFNVMHWHISDAQSFPLEVHDSPARELGGGSYAAQSNGLSPTLQYNTSDVQTVVQFARNRGIRVIPEFDVPGHAYAWGLGNPNIVTDCPAYAHNINNIPLLASANETYQVIESLLRQVRPLFTDKVLHLGGDEVVLGCWGQDSRITRFMQEQGFQELSQVMQYFVTRVDEIATKLGWTVAHWQDVFDDEIATPMSAIMQVWRNKADVGPIIAWGNEVVVSNSDAWYLNCGFNPGCKYISWADVYANDPLTGITPAPTPSSRKLVLGGEAVMFGEFADHTNIAAQMWPRASAVGERLWSASSVTDAAAALPRAHAQRCRMVARGIDASPVGPGFC